MAKTKISQIFWPFPLYIVPIFQLAFGTHQELGCSDLSPFLFGSSPTVIELDKIVAEIINTIFFGHPRVKPYSEIVAFFNHDASPKFDL